MQETKFNFQVIQFNKIISVELSTFKPDNLIRYRASISNEGSSRIIMLYRQDDGRFQLYDCGNWMENDLAKKVALKVKGLEKEFGELLLHQLQTDS